MEKKKTSQDTSDVIICYHPLNKTSILRSSRIILTFQAPIQKSYRSLDHLSFSRKYSPMWEQYLPAWTEEENLVITTS